MGYGYSTNSNFTPASGWTSTGTASASMSGSMSTSYSANSPYSISYNDDSGNWATISGTVTGSGSGRGGYNYNQTDSLASDGTWSVTSGSGGGSGGQGWTWGYSGSGSYSQASGGGALTVSNVEQTQGGVNQYGSSAYDPEDYLPSGVGPGAISDPMTNAVDPQATPSPASVLDQSRAGILAAFARYIGFLGGRHLGHGQRGRGRLRRQQLRLRDRICLVHAADSLGGRQQSLVIAGVHVGEDAGR